MFIRKKKNDSGKTCVQIIDKSTGKYKVAHTVGSSDDPDTIKQFVRKAREWINAQSGNLQLDFTNEVRLAHQFLDCIQSLKLAGPDLLLERIFDEIGFNQIKDPIFKYLALYRLIFPKKQASDNRIPLPLSPNRLGRGPNLPLPRQTVFQPKRSRPANQLRPYPGNPQQ